MVTSRLPGFMMRRDLDGFPDAIIPSLFQSSDQGMILTGPNREVVAINRAFADLFGVEAESLFHSPDVEAVRGLVAHRFADSEDYRRRTDEVYGHANATVKEEFQLKEPTRYLERSSIPVIGEDGHHVGRLWSFRDVTEARRHERMRDLLYRVSVYNDPDPTCICAFIADEVGAFYGVNGVVSLLRDDFVEFRAVGGPETTLAGNIGMPLQSTCCRLPIESLQATIVRDVPSDSRTRETLVARLGVRSYLGTPLLSAQGTVRGTLALMSSRADIEFDDDDLRFVSLLAMRVASELERARVVEVELAARQRVMDDQAADLAATREVLDAMVHSFDLTSFDETIETVLVAQAALLENLLGFGTVAIVAQHGSDGQLVLATPYEQRPLGTLEAVSEVRRPTWLRRDALRQLGLEGLTEALAVPIETGSRVFGLLIYESERKREIDDHRRIHLEALAEQVALTLEAYTLRADLLKANQEAGVREAEAVLTGRLGASGLLAATVAHDVKNIVAAISLELAGTSEPLRALTAVRVHLDRFAILSHRLLSYSKPRMVVKRPINLDELIHRVTSLFNESMRISDIQLVFSPAKAPVVILGDPHQIEHLFANLILNAVQAMSARSGGLIEIRVKRVGKRAVIEVRDTGPGLPEENLDKMFEPFVGFRHEGFGLGLFAARRIANEHGGDVKVASTLGVGSVFTVTLQAAPTEP